MFNLVSSLYQLKEVIFNLQWAFGAEGSTFVFHCVDQGSDPGHLYIKVLFGSNRLFLCPLDVINELYCHQSVPCVLVT